MANTPIQNDKIDYNNILCEAVDKIIQKRLENVKYDNTVVAEVIDTTNAQYGHYMVQEGKITYDVLSENTNYRVGDKVYVTIPGDDYNNTKIIVSAYKDAEEIKALSLVKPSDIYLKTELPVAQPDPATIHINAGVAIDDNFEADLIELPWNVANKDKHIYQLLMLCDTLILSADVQCYLNNSEHYTYSGEYGLNVYLQADEDEPILIGSLSSQEFIGNPYTLATPVHQNVIINLKNLTFNAIPVHMRLLVQPYRSKVFQQYNLLTNEQVDLTENLASMIDFMKEMHEDIPEEIIEQISENYCGQYDISFNNFKVVLGFNAKNKNKTLELYASEGDDNNVFVLPIWYNIDETTGEEIRFADDNPTLITELTGVMRDSLNLFNTKIKTLPQHIEKTIYDVYLDFFNMGTPYRRAIQLDMHNLVYGDSTNLPKLNLDTKESLYIYSQGIELDDNLSNCFNQIQNLGEALVNIQPFTLLDNQANPVLVDYSNNSIMGATCQLEFSPNNNEGYQYEVKLMPANNNDIVKVNYLFLTLKYFKDLVELDGGLSSNPAIGDLKYSNSADESFNFNILSEQSNEYAYIFIMLKSNDLNGFPLSTNLLTIPFQPKQGIDLKGAVPIFIEGYTNTMQNNDAVSLVPDNLLNHFDIANSWPKIGDKLQLYTRCIYLQQYNTGAYGEQFISIPNVSKEKIFASDMQALITTTPLLYVRGIKNNENNTYYSPCYDVDNNIYYLTSDPTLTHHMLMPFYCYEGTKISFNLNTSMDDSHTISCRLFKNDNNVLSDIFTISDTGTSTSVTEKSYSISFPNILTSGEYLIDLIMTSTRNNIPMPHPQMSISNLVIKNQLHLLQSDYGQNTITKQMLLNDSALLNEFGRNAICTLYPSIYQGENDLISTETDTDNDEIVVFKLTSLPARSNIALTLTGVSIPPDTQLLWDITNEDSNIVTYLYVNDLMYTNGYINTTKEIFQPNKVTLVVANTGLTNRSDLLIDLPTFIIAEDGPELDLPIDDETPQANLIPRNGTTTSIKELELNEFINTALTYVPLLENVSDSNKVFKYRDLQGNSTNLCAVFPSLIINEVGSNTPHGYVYGTSGLQLASGGTAFEQQKTYYWNNHYKNSNTYKNNKALYNSHFDKWKNRVVCDCQGLLDSYVRTVISGFDINANMNYTSWCKKAVVSDFYVGDAVFTVKNGTATHVGWICGYLVNTNNKICDYLVVEAKGLKFGVVITRYSQGNWTHHCRMTEIYNNQVRWKEWQNNPTISPILLNNLWTDAPTTSVAPEGPAPQDNPNTFIVYTYTAGSPVDLGSQFDQLDTELIKQYTFFPRSFLLNSHQGYDYWSDHDINQADWSTDSTLNISYWLDQLKLLNPSSTNEDISEEPPQISTLANVSLIFKQLKIITANELAKGNIKAQINQRPWHNAFRQHFAQYVKTLDSKVWSITDEYDLSNIITNILTTYEHLCILYDKGYQSMFALLKQYQEDPELENQKPILDMYFSSVGIAAFQAALDDIQLSINNIMQYYKTSLAVLINYFLPYLYNDFNNSIIGKNQELNDTTNLSVIFNYLAQLPEDTQIAADYEREKSLFLKYCKNRYDFYLYTYKANNTDDTNTYLLDTSWQYELISIQDIYQPTENNGTNLTQLTWIPMPTNTAIRAVLIYNHQPYYSNILFNSEIKEGQNK